MAKKGLFSTSFVLPNGKRKFVTAKTQAALEEKVFQLKLEMRMGVDISDQTTVGELAQIWYNLEKKGKVKPTTERQWKGLLNNRILPEIGARLVKEVNPAMIQNLLNKYLDKCQSDNRKMLQALRGMFEIAVENGMISKTPVLARFKAGGIATPEKQALTPAQAEALVSSLEGTTPELFVRLGLETGMRRGELLGLMWDCVDLENAVVKVRRNYVMTPGHCELSDELKTTNSRRDLPLTPGMVELLRERKRTAKSVFVITRKNGQAFDLDSFRTFWEPVQRRIGVEEPKSHRGVFIRTEQAVTPHTLRHTFATRCVESGMPVNDVQALMGHSDPTITLKIYTHFCKASREEEAFANAREAAAVGG